MQQQQQQQQQGGQQSQQPPGPLPPSQEQNRKQKVQQQLQQPAGSRSTVAIQGADQGFPIPNVSDLQMDSPQDRKRARNNSIGAFSPVLSHAASATPLQHHASLMMANAGSPNMIGSPTPASAAPVNVAQDPPTKSGRRKKAVKKEQSVDPAIEAATA
ncbi:hypothetical protein BGZ94_005694, partial [Podila epigama]